MPMSHCVYKMLIKDIKLFCAPINSCLFFSKVRSEKFSYILFHVSVLRLSCFITE